jgi:hypothetical protein
MMMNSTEAIPSFEQRLWGRFAGVLRWTQLEALWGRVRAAASSGWYIYDLEAPPPATPAPTEELTAFLKQVDEHLRHEHEQDYCGIVYADDLDEPSLVKIYAPGNLGAVCGTSGSRVLPRWIISRMQPSALRKDIASELPPIKWWHRLFRPHSG